MANDAFILQGGNGGTVIADTTPTAGNWKIIQVINDAVIDAVSGSLTGVNGLEGLTLPAGLILGGGFTAITLISGAVIAYD